MRCGYLDLQLRQMSPINLALLVDLVNILRVKLVKLVKFFSNTLFALLMYVVMS
jgi:hypothetical protein